MMTLLDILLSEEKEQQHSDAAHLHSIRQHLERLLNTRQGSLRHLPEYGIPDINAVFQQLPDSVYMLTQAIRLAIERYEPRLKNIEVYTKQDDRDDTVIQCIIQAALCNEVAIQYLTFFLGSRQVKVEI